MLQLKVIQYGALISIFVLSPFVDWSITSVLGAVVAYYLYSGIGVSMMLHRFWSHHEFQFKHKWTEYLCLVLVIGVARGSPLAWVHIHRSHHTNSDTTEDPHRPTNKLRLFSFDSTKIHKVNLKLVRDIIKSQLQVRIHDYYLCFIFAYIATLIVIGGIDAFYFLWALPVCLYQLSQDLWNYYGHKDGVGYRNFETKDKSKNVPWLFPIVLGEAWHNNHHNNVTGKSKSSNFEPDPIGWIIKKVKA